MTRLTVGIVGWRGMVGSVLMDRMREMGDFKTIKPVFFSTSQAGQVGPADAGGALLSDAYDLEVLSAMDVILTCQGGDYTKQIHSNLREMGWQGFWIDAASTLRMDSNAVLVLDPVNRAVIDAGIDAGKKDLIGVNCTVSPMLMGLAGLFNRGLIEWVSAMTYQAASGAGARAMQELLQQMRDLGRATDEMLDNPNAAIMKIDQTVNDRLASSDFPTYQLGAALAGNALPWIDSEMESGMSREEWKGMVETNKILGTEGLAIDGTCVRIGAMRSHSLGLTVKLKKDIPLADIEEMIASAHEWVKVVPNTKSASVSQLSPAAVSGSMKIHVGRLRKMKMGDEYLNAFIVGDQLLWGAAEPLRRALRIVVEKKV